MNNPQRRLANHALVAMAVLAVPALASASAQSLPTATIHWPWLEMWATSAAKVLFWETLRLDKPIPPPSQAPPITWSGQATTPPLGRSVQALAQAVQAT